MYVFAIWSRSCHIGSYGKGSGPKPNITWDNGYPYNPNAVPTASDYYEWAHYGALLAGAQALGHLPDGTRAYAHYRDNTGTDLAVDYEKAIADDSGIKAGVDAELEAVKAAIEQMHGSETSFEFHSDEARLVNSSTENWQKALGGHRIWSSGSVVFDPATCQFTATITIDMEDFYNFNKGQVDIATGLPDDPNGRFEVLGWAKSFYSRGSITRTLTWKKGDAVACEVPIGGGR